MGVRSGVTRAEQMLKTKLKNKKQVQVMWRKVEEMHHFYAFLHNRCQKTPFLTKRLGKTAPTSLSEDNEPTVRKLFLHPKVPLPQLFCSFPHFSLA